MEQYAQNKLLDSICLDQLIRRYVKQTGSVADVDDLARLLDGREENKFDELMKRNNRLISSEYSR